MRKRMEEWYDIKNRGMMGSGDGEIKVVTILGRTVRWTEEGIEYEADGEHRAKLMSADGVGGGFEGGGRTCGKGQRWRGGAGGGEAGRGVGT
jgi:hypothetical protein